MSNSVRPHGRQPTRLPRPWDSPGKSTGVGCHFLLQCMKVKSESEVAQSYQTLRDPMDYSLPGSFIHGIFLGKSTGVGCHRLLQHKCLGSRFIYLIRTDSNVLLWLSNCVYVLQLLYPFICQQTSRLLPCPSSCK